jgi:organic hydroperoxide reductase OsmC/OhrA
MDVEIRAGVGDGHAKQLERCAKIFESFCIVSQSVSQGIPLNVKVN